MITPSNTASAQQNARQAADGLLNSADKAIDHTRTYANHALDAADSKMHELKRAVEPALDKLSSKAQAIAQQGMDMAGQAKDKAKESLSHYSTVTSRYVAEKPIQSVLIAAAVGAAVALVVSAARNRNRY
jgi:ElaB/YqjD/DUF883 family membrane-anchored ribosome-binding protein